MNDLSFEVKDYSSETYGAKVGGHWSEADAFYYLESSLPKRHVIIPESVRVNQVLEYIAPHPDCHANHDHKPVRKTYMHARVFKDVLDGHRKAVLHFGVINRIVRVPYIIDYKEGLPHA